MRNNTAEENRAYICYLAKRYSWLFDVDKILCVGDGIEMNWEGELLELAYEDKDFANKFGKYLLRSGIFGGLKDHAKYKKLKRIVDMSEKK